MDYLLAIGTENILFFKYIAFDNGKLGEIRRRKATGPRSPEYRVARIAGLPKNVHLARDWSPSSA